jgi:hypothetical protein
VSTVASQQVPQHGSDEDENQDWIEPRHQKRTLAFPLIQRSDP